MPFLFLCSLNCMVTWLKIHFSVLKIYWSNMVCLLVPLIYLSIFTPIPHWLNFLLSLRVNSISIPTLFSLLKIVLASLGHFNLNRNFIISFSTSTKKSVEIFFGKAFFGKALHVVILKSNLLMYVDSIALHLIRSVISFSNILYSFQCGNLSYFLYIYS